MYRQLLMFNCSDSSSCTGRCSCSIIQIPAHVPAAARVKLFIFQLIYRQLSVFICPDSSSCTRSCSCSNVQIPAHVSAAARVQLFRFLLLYQQLIVFKCSDSKWLRSRHTTATSQCCAVHSKINNVNA